MFKWFWTIFSLGAPEWSVTSERTFSAVKRLQELHKKHNEAGPSEKLASECKQALRLVKQ